MKFWSVELKLAAPWWNNDRPTNQPIDRPTNQEKDMRGHREVKLSIILCIKIVLNLICWKYRRSPKKNNVNQCICFVIWKSFLRLIYDVCTFKCGLTHSSTILTLLMTSRFLLKGRCVKFSQFNHNTVPKKRKQKNIFILVRIELLF